MTVLRPQDIVSGEHDAGYIIDRRDAVVHLSLNRSALHNAFDEHLIASLRDLFAAMAKDGSIRLMVLKGSGRSFSAGADLNWMRRAANQDEASNIEDARQLEAMLSNLDSLPFPVISRIQGAAIGGGLGLVACSDIALATPNAIFAASEVRLGIVPAVISPFVIRAIGARQARRYFLTAERFDAETAMRLGLVHEVVDEGEIDDRIAGLAQEIHKGGAQAIASSKRLIAEVMDLRGEERAAYCARQIAERRASDEGKEGIDAFLSKRKPSWTL